MAIYHCSIKIIKRSQGKSAVAAAAYRSGEKLTNEWDGNPHAHIMLTLRPLEQDGTWGAKCRKEYDLDGHGQRIRLPSGAFKSHRVNTTDWNDKDKAEQWRLVWAKYANRALEQKGIAERIDHRSYKRQGVEQIPSVHLGVAATQMERRGIQTDKGNINREIATQNKLLKEIKARITRLYNWSKEQSTQPEDKSIMAQLWQAQQEMAQPTSQYGKIKALKENATLFSFLQSNGISSMQELCDKVDAMNTDYYALRGDIRNDERRITILTAHFEQYGIYSKFKGKRRNDGDEIRYRSAERYLAGIKERGEPITPKKWQSELAALIPHKDLLYEKMRAMREDIKAVEKIRKAADQLARTEIPQKKEQKHER